MTSILDYLLFVGVAVSWGMNTVGLAATVVTLYLVLQQDKKVA